MTSEEMLAYARVVAEGGQVKKTDVVAFMKALLAQAEEPEPDLQAGGPAMTTEQVVEVYLPNLPFEIETTMNGGIHMPRESNRSYTKLEATALVYKIAKAIGFAVRE